jgi:signal transduction histidine kinase
VFSKLTIRSRITIGSFIVAAVITAIALLGLRAQIERILLDADISLAQTDLASFVTDIEQHPAEPMDPPAPGLLVYVRSPSGVEAVNSIPTDLRDELAFRDPRAETFAIHADGKPYTIVARVVHTTTGDWALWAARSGEASALASAALDRALIIGGIILLGIFAIASWLLTSAALRPVARMRREAEGLNSATSSQRLAVGPADDELAELGTTLNEFLDRVQQSAEREKQMVSDAAHELRTPLAALKTQLELAHADFGDATALEREIVAAEGSVERLSSLATGLLELSRLEAHEDALAESTVNELESELMGSIDRARMLALAKQVDVSFETQYSDPSARVQLASTSFGRLLDNLLSNAVVAVAVEGTVRVTLRDSDSEIELEVADDGPGVPASFLAVAFDRFTRPDNSRTSTTGGAGLGLALVRGIARSAGGDVSLRNSHPGLVAVVHIPKM